MRTLKTAQALEYPELAARFYDPISTSIRSSVDHNYFLREMRAAGGPVLEVGVGVRVWESIPSNWRALHSELQAQTAIAMQSVLDQQARLETQQVLTTKSQQQLERRMAELAGDPDPVEGASQDTRDGLVVALRKEESARNEQLQVLDQLRHEFDAKYNELTRLLEQNRDLAGRLPQPPTKTGEPSEPALGRTQVPIKRR